MKSKIMILSAWKAAKPVAGRNPKLWRQDRYGSLMFWLAYGKHGEFSWEVDHIKPLANGGVFNRCNCQALQWTNNKRKSNKSNYKPKKVEAVKK